jgi:hypothetical protein
MAKDGTESRPLGRMAFVSHRNRMDVKEWHTIMTKYNAILLVMGLIVAATMLGASIAIAQQVPQPVTDLGAPAQDVREPFVIVSVEQAQAQVDYPLATLGTVPSGTRLEGAFFAAPTVASLYPNAPPNARAQLQSRDRLRPIGLLYDGPLGHFAVTLTSVGIGPVPPPMGTDPRPIGIEQAGGERKTVGGFEYAVRTVAGQRLIPGETRFPEGTLTLITWQSATPGKGLSGVHAGFRLYDLQWTVSGLMPESELLQIAQGAR